MKQRLHWDYNMPKLIYTSKALDDLQGIKTYVSRQFGGDRAKIQNGKIVGTIRNVGRGGCYALYFCGKLQMEVI